MLTLLCVLEMATALGHEEKNITAVAFVPSAFLPAHLPDVNPKASPSRRCPPPENHSPPPSFNRVSCCQPQERFASQKQADEIKTQVCLKRNEAPHLHPVHRDLKSDPFPNR